MGLIVVHTPFPQCRLRSKSLGSNFSFNELLPFEHFAQAISSLKSDLSYQFILTKLIVRNVLLNDMKTLTKGNKLL